MRRPAPLRMVRTSTGHWSRALLLLKQTNKINLKSNSRPRTWYPDNLNLYLKSFQPGEKKVKHCQPCAQGLLKKLSC